jgi:hypothetical protein
MQQKAFVILAKINKKLLPSLLHADLNRLTKAQKLLVSYRYWVTTRSLPD